MLPFKWEYYVYPGIVNNPMTGHLYTAIKGRGAFLNGTDKLSVSVRS